MGTAKKSEPAKTVKLTPEQAQALAHRSRVITERLAPAVPAGEVASETGNAVGSCAARAIGHILQRERDRFDAERKRQMAERRERLASRIERVIASRDRCGFWAHYTGRTREEHVTAVRLIRGGIDLNAAKIVSVTIDLPPEA